MTSHHDIIARLERSPAAWVCIRREAADEIRKLRSERDAISAKLNAIVAELEHYAASDGLIAPLAAAVLREIEETK